MFSRPLRSFTLLAGLVLFLCNLSARETELLNRGYKFTFGDPDGAAKKTFDDSSWSAATIPHSFSTPFWGEDRFFVGQGWYRRELDIKPEWKGKRIALDFEGVFQECEVYINGQKAGKHQGGYTGFELDITKYVIPGKNTLAIHVNNFWNPELAPRAGGYVFPGGIYRDVRLTVTDPLHVTWYGTFVTTPQVSEQEATVRMATEIRNDDDAPTEGTLVTTLVDPGGKKVSDVQTPFKLAAGETKEIIQNFEPVHTPRLWHPDTPQQYRAETTLFRKGKKCDSHTTPFGIRWFEFTKDKGFFLNGKPYYIQGANVHQDRAGWGDAAVNADFYRDVKMIKEAGMNFIRGSHYPHDPAFSQACDELGMLFWSENVFWGIGGFREDGYWDSSAYPPNPAHHKKFEQSLRQSLHDMIRIHRNHPSIVTWSMGNEIFFTDKKVMEDAKNCLRRLVQYSKELDPTRPAAVGGVQREGFDKIGEIAGYNGDGAYVTNPVLPSLVSEYGSVIAHRPGEFGPGLGCTEGQEKFPWRSGVVIWSGFHYGCIASNIGYMGFIDYARLPLRSWYWYRQNLSGIPAPKWPEKGTPAALSLQADKTRINADGTDDTHLTVSVLDASGKHIDASPAVTLTIESGPGTFPTGKSITFTENNPASAIREGLAAIEFRSYYSGKTRIRATSPNLKDTLVEVENVNAPAFIPGKSPEWLPVAGPKTAPKQARAARECAQSRPAIASFSAPGSEPKWGNDGAPSTCWQTVCSPEGTAWWRLDMENFYHVEEVILTLPSPADFIVEVSADEGKTWIPAGTQADAVKTGKRYILTCHSEKVHGRFLRITYTGTPGTPISQENLEVRGKQ